MTLYDILTIKFPNADFNNDIILQDDGNGAYIKEWFLKESKPTNKQIEKWKVELKELHQFRTNLILNSSIYKQLEELDLKSIRALRTKDTEKLAAIEEEAQILRNKLLPTGN